eukprot:362498_1
MFTKLIFVVISISSVIQSHVIYEGLLKKDWMCMYGFESNNCDQTIEDNFKCSSHKVNTKGGDGVAIFPSNNRAIQLYHNGDVHETDHNIIIGWKFHCSSHCHTSGAQLNRISYGFDFASDVAGGIWNHITYTDKLFYTVFSTNLTHVTTSIYQGGVPDTNDWSITSYITHYGTGSILIDPNDSEMIQALKYSYIKGYVGDTYEDKTAYFQITYIATDAGFIELNTESIPNPVDWMKAVDSSVINWNYPVTFDGFTDTVSYYTNSNWGTFNFLNMNNFDQLFPGVHKSDVVGFSVQTYINVGNKDYNGFDFRGGYKGDGAARFAGCWQTSYMFLYQSRMDSTTEDYAQVHIGAELGSGSVQIYLRDFKWLFDSHNTTEELINCNDIGGIKHPNWYDLTNVDDNSPDKPYSNLIMDVDINTLTFTFDIELDYIGSASDGYWDKAYNLGSTYVISFEPFGITDRLDEPGSCENRMKLTFSNKSFSEWWTYSETPYLSGHLGVDTYTAYPVPSYPWVLSMDSNNSCSRIHYIATFSWNDMQSCTNYNGESLMEVVDYDGEISLSGRIYVTLVSPETMTLNSGYYRTFSLIQQEFGIFIPNQINVIDSVGIKLFIPLIFGNFPKNETDHSFILPIVVRSPQYIELDLPQVLTTPFGVIGTSIQQITDSCILEGSYLCRQFFTIKIQSEVINCPPADFSGTYNMQFDVSCPSNEDVCDTFIDDNDGSTVVLEVISNFIDETCEPELYEIIFNGQMIFYDDEQFSIIHNDQNGENNYVIGQDIIYIQVETNIPDDGSGDNFRIFGVEINNVFVCTVDDNTDINSNLDQQNGNGGCLSSNIDPDGPYDIITNGLANSNYMAQIISSTGDSNIVQFSFLTFDVGRTVMYAHVQLTLILQNGNRRRLELSQVANNQLKDNNYIDVSDQIRHFVDSTGIKPLTSTLESTMGGEVDYAKNLSLCLSIFVCFVTFILY